MLGEKLSVGLLQLSHDLNTAIEGSAGEGLAFFRVASLEAFLTGDATQRNDSPGGTARDALALVARLSESGLGQAVVRIGKAHPKLPVVVLAPAPTLAEATPVLRAGAFSVADLNDTSAASAAVVEAGREGVALRPQRQHLLDLHRRFSELTKAEHQVLDAMLDGMANKQIAQTLEIGLRTVELRRSKIMRKMHASNLAELVKFVCLVLPEVVAEPPPGEFADRHLGAAS